MSAWSGRFRRHPWIVPLAFAAAFAAVGVSTVRELELRERHNIRSELEATVETANEALALWSANNEAIVSVFAEDARVREALAELARLARLEADPSETLRAASAQARLRDILDPVARIYGFRGWGAQDLTGLMIANQADDQVGFRPQALADRRVETISSGEVTHTAPISYDTPSGSLVLMIVGGPVSDAQGTAVATLGFSLDPRTSFSKILEAARPGESGETYAFDEAGLLVSRSRFESQLREIGLLPADPAQGSALRLSIRDPGGNMLEGYRSDLPEKARAYTRAAASAIAGESGFDVEGYRDYRGVPVVGAWTWVPGLRIGLASEIDRAEAFAGVRGVRWRLAAVLVLLIVATLGLAAYSWAIRRLQGEIDAARKLGRYRVERKIGRGGMGTVYLARHALLRRPTAVKVLESDGGAEGEAATRFEREVQVSSSLSHPNTIEIYDYGRSEQGDFYYAMEYVGGLNLARLVETDGPQPDARVRAIMTQAAGSVAEAHTRGLIHRDLKPANIMICERGGIHDFVKVLDFGLVRSRERRDDLSITRTQALTGTPLYMPPEALEDPSRLDARGDVYQLGAVAYFLLVGQPPFSGNSVVEVLAKHMKDRPPSPESVLGRAVSPDLVDVILRCLEKSPADRFEDAQAVLAALTEAEIEGRWTESDARQWWEHWQSDPANVEDDGSSSGSGSVSLSGVLQVLGGSRRGSG